MRQVVGGWSYDTREAFDRGMVIILVRFSSWLESRVGWGTWLWQSTDDSNTFHCTKSFSRTTESSKSSRTSASFHHTVVDQLQRDLKKEDRAMLAIKKINVETVTLVVFGHWRLSSWASHAWDLDMIWERLDVKEPRLLNGCSRHTVYFWPKKMSSMRRILATILGAIFRFLKTKSDSYNRSVCDSHGMWHNC